MVALVCPHCREPFELATATAEGALSLAVTWLADRLVGGPVPATLLVADALRAGIATRTLERARRELGTRAVRDGSQWVVALPEGSTYAR